MTPREFITGLRIVHTILRAGDGAWPIRDAALAIVRTIG